MMEIREREQLVIDGEGMPKIDKKAVPRKQLQYFHETNPHFFTGNARNKAKMPKREHVLTGEQKCARSRLISGSHSYVN